jgi:hypothetical protein
VTKPDQRTIAGRFGLLFLALSAGFGWWGWYLVNDQMLLGLFLAMCAFIFLCLALAWALVWVVG